MDSEQPGERAAFGVAIIGMSGRFPGAPDVDRLWENLCAGVESIRAVTDADLAAAGVDPRVASEPGYVRARGALSGVELFDAGFFGMSPREAAITDPQHRLFLECAWEALERAGYDPARLGGPTGVYAGTGSSGYLVHHVAPSLGDPADLALLVGNDKDHLTTRVAFKLDLRGPALTVQTACSTSLVAVQLACQALLGYQCDLALAGGVSIGFPLGVGYRFHEGDILSPDGRCRPFSAQAAGTVAGDGAGVVVLKRLADALADGDHVHAVILGAAVNNDGSHKIGYTAPSVAGQAEVIALAQELAGVDPATIGYVEAHGTGTALGDPIEVAALTQAFRAATPRTRFCSLGSIKPNIGHLNTAAGVAGLIKAALVVERGAIPPVLHYTAPNPEIDFAASPFFVDAARRSWPRDGGPRRAGVSSFGFGGTNAHVVIEEAPAPPPPGPSTPSTMGGDPPSPPPRRSRKLLVLSARSPAALDAASENLAAHLERHPEVDLAGAAYTLQVGRRAFLHRRAVVCADARDAVEALRDPRRGITTEASPEATPGVVFLFPGQGAQHARMGEALYRAEPVFRDHVDRAAEALVPHLGLDLREALFAADGDALLRGTALAQPALFVVEHALAQLLLAAGVTPRALAGHSLGEYVAATLAGVFTLPDALAVVAARGRLMAGAAPGAMLAVPLPEQEIRPLLGEGLALAAVNGPRACVAAGPVPAIEALEARLAARGLPGRRLAVDRAFHSAMMVPAAAELRAIVERVPRRAPRIPYLSNLTGRWVTAAEAMDPAYWARHLCETVRFSANLDALLAGDAVGAPPMLLEVGPGRALSAMVEAQAGVAIPCLARPGSGSSDEASVLEAIGRVWAAGSTIEWSAIHAGERPRRIPLPTYPFERRRYWIDPPAARPAPGGDDLMALDAPLKTIAADLAVRSIDDHPGLAGTLDRLCASHVAAYLRQAGVPVDREATASRADLRRRLGIVPKLTRLFDALLAILEEDGVIVAEGDALRFTGRARDLPSPAAIRASLDAAHPGFRGLFDLVDHCARSHADALAGRIEAIGVLYPGGSAELLARVERETVVHRSERIYIALLTDVLRRAAGAARGRPLRILEAGGGQGLMTWPLLAALEGYDVEYCFTDLGRVFVDDARAEASRRGLSGRMTFRVLDAGADPAEQGFTKGSFDAVLAFNVVHATPDVDVTTAHLSSLLAPGGLLALIEIVRTRRWDVLTWGLAEQWWSFADARRRTSPLLDLGTWEDVLRARGFSEVAAYPRDPAARARTDHGLILARGPAAAPAVIQVPARSPAAPVSPGATSPGAAHPRPALRTPYVAPRTELERLVATVCADLLGVDRVGAHDDFFELGADSLVTLRLTDRLRRELGLDVPPHVAFRGATVERIARALGGERDPGAGSPAIPIQPEGSQPPLFFVHPASGVVFPYVELARLLGPDQPFYGLQALGLDGEAEPDEHIEDMARHYVEAVRAVAPRGPYYLGGFSFGCLVAFEMAQQLAAAGEEVALLALVDEPAPVFGHRPTPVVMADILATGIAKSIWPYLHDYFYLARASESAAPPARKPVAAPARRPRASEILESLLARATIANYVPRESRLLALRQPAMVPMARLFFIHLREALAYEPKAYPQRVTLFRATHLGGRNAKDPTQGWGLLAAGGVEVRDLPGEHLTVLREPHVRVLAAELADCLARARRDAASRRR